MFPLDPHTTPRSELVHKAGFKPSYGEYVDIVLKNIAALHRVPYAQLIEEIPSDRDRILAGKRHFIQRYNHLRPPGFRQIGNYKVAMPCNCGDSTCTGWAAVYDDMYSLRRHINMCLMRMGHESRLFNYI